MPKYFFVICIDLTEVYGIDASIGLNYRYRKEYESRIHYRCLH